MTILDQFTVFRGLSEVEKETLIEGLRRVAGGAMPRNQIAAKSMLEQNMVDNFLWRSHE